ncbi:hypothetical protein Tco_0542097 [Tanacetum coccineum]
MQQFWNTMKYDEKTGVYSCQVDEQWFDLSADLLRKALAITPVIPAQPFELPSSGNTVIDFVNELGYPEPVEIVSNIRVNYVYQPWRAILTLINQAVMGRVYSRDPDIFLTQGKSQSQSEGPKEESNSSPHSLWTVFQGNLKFVPKGETVEVFGMAIPDPLITEAIQQSSYYPKYLEMVAKNTKKTPQESASVQPATKRAPPKKPTTTTPVKQSKPAPAPTKKPSKHKLPQKVRKGKPTFQLVDEDDEAQQESVPQEEGDDPDLELAKKMSLEAHQEKEQGEEKQDSTYSISKTANRNPANYHLYHALMEALIADEDAMDKEVKDKVKNHKRKHDSDDDEDDDDDDEGPSAGSNHGKSAKRRRHDSGASRSAQPLIKDDEQSSKKPRESDASASKLHPALTLIGWHITDTRDAIVDSSMHRSDPELEHSEQSLYDIPMQDEGHLLDLEDTDNAHFPKVSTTTRTGKKKLCKADLEGPAFNLVKAFHKNSVFLQFQMDECHKLLTNKVDLVNHEGHQILRNIYEPLPLGGPPGQVTIQPQFFFNKDLDYLLTGDKERKIALSISKLKAARYLDFGLEELVPSLWVESERDYDISAAYGITHWWFRRKEFYINKHSEPSDREAVRSQMRILSVISVKVYEKYGYNYLREIILRRADYKEYKISEKDFKNLHPNDFEDLFLLNIQEKLNHLPKTDKTSLHTAVNMWIRNLVIRNRVGDLQLGIESYQTKINLERPNWDAADYYFKEDYTIVPKPRAVCY